MRNRKTGLLVLFRNEYFELFGIKDKNPPIPETYRSEYGTLLLVQEKLGDSGAIMIEVLAKMPTS